MAYWWKKGAEACEIVRIFILENGFPIQNYIYTVLYETNETFLWWFSFYTTSYISLTKIVSISTD